MKIVYEDKVLVVGDVKEFKQEVIYGADGKTKLYTQYTLVLRVDKESDPEPDIIIEK